MTRTFRSWAYIAYKVEFSYLGRMHWHVGYALKSAAQSIRNLPSPSSPSGFVGNVLPVSGFDAQRLGITAADYLSGEDDIINHLRVLLLLKGVSALEALINRYVQLHVASLGYLTTENKLSKAGEALAKPGLASNIVASGKYLQHLLGIRFPDQLVTKLSDAYSIRCTMAHNGGIVDGKAAKRFPKFASRRGLPIHLAWEDLNIYLEAIQDAATRFELAFPADTLRNTENNWLIRDIIDTSPGISAKEIAARLYNEYRRDKRPDKRAIAGRFKVPL